MPQMITLLYLLIQLPTPCENLLRAMDLVESMSEAKQELVIHAPFVTPQAMDDAIMRLFKRAFLKPVSLRTTDQEANEFVHWMAELAKKIRKQ